MKKILFVLQLPPPIHGSSMMGRFIKESELINSHYDAKFINSMFSRNMDELGKVSLNKLLIYISVLYKTINALLVFQPDICYIALSAKGISFYKDCIVISLFKLFHKKVVLHFHNKGVAQYQNRWIDNKLYRFVFRDSNVILLSYRLYEDVSKYVNKQNVLICPNGISNITNNEHTKKENLTVKLLFLSNMMEQKGVYDLLDACSILYDRGLKFNCDFVGKWSDIKEEIFNSKVKEKNLFDIVSAYGGKYGKDKFAYMNDADVFIFPTYNETFGIVIIEAMQCGLPVVTTNEGGIPDIVEDGVTGFIVEKQNPQLLANRIEELILNPELREKMGKAGRQKFEKQFTLAHFEKRMCEIFDLVIKKMEVCYEK